MPDLAPPIGLFTPQRLHKWQVKIPRTGFPPYLIGAISLPRASVGAEQFRIAARNIKVAGWRDDPNVSIQFQETEFGDVMQALEAWRDAIIDPNNGTYGYPEQYKARIICELLTGDNLRIATVTLIDCFPTGGPPLQLTYDKGSNGGLIIEQEFSVDDIKFDYR